MSKKLFGVTAVLTLAVLTLFFKTAFPAHAQNNTTQQGLVEKSKITFQEFLMDPNMTWIQENLKYAKGVLIIPNLLKGGFILGGSGGSGVLVVKDSVSGLFSYPAFYTIGSVTFGLQIGGESAEVIMVLRTQKAVDSLLTSSFTLGGDTSIAVGPVGGGGKFDVVADIVSFSRTKGAYAGVSLEGAVIKTQDEWNYRYYGQPVTPVDILVRNKVTNDGADSLVGTVSRAAK